MSSEGNALKSVAPTYRQQNARPAFTPLASNNARDLEAAFWDKRLVDGRQVTTTDVLKAYNKDTYSLRSGFFFKNLYLRQVRHEGRQMTVEDVITEFNRKRDPQSKCLLAVAHLKEECCLKDISINGRPVNASEVADSFPVTPSGKLSLARFREECSLKKIPIHSQPVSTESVVNDLLALDARLELARFREECCLKQIPIHGQPVSTELVVNDFLAIGARLELARFKQTCCLESLAINGRQVATKEVFDLLRAAGDKLGLAYFQRECCLRELPIAGQRVTPESVLKGFQGLGDELGLAYFQKECCLREWPIAGQRVTPESVLKGFQGIGAKLEAAHFLEECLLKGINLERGPISADWVADSLQATNAHLGLARFKASCFLEGLMLHNRPISPEMVVDSFPTNREGRLGLAHFKASCCLNGFLINGRPVSAEEVLSHYPKGQLGAMSHAHFMEECFMRNIPVNGQPVTAKSVLSSFPSTPHGKVGQARFLENCCLGGLRIQGRLVTPDSVMQSFPDNPKGLMCRARFRQRCILRGLSLFGKPITTQEVLANFPDTREGRMAAGHFLELCFFKDLTLGGQAVTAEAVFKALDTPESTIVKACFLAGCCLRDRPLHGRPVTADVVVAAYPGGPHGQKQLLFFKKKCCLNNIPLAGKSIQPEQVVHELEQKNMLAEKAYFCADLALQARKLNGNYLSDDQVLGAFDRLAGDHSIQKVHFLIHRLIALPEGDYSQESRATFGQAWEILAGTPVRDNRSCHLRCVMLFMAMKYNLPVAGQPATPDLVWQSIRPLRDSFRNTRLQFYFLADCCFTDTALDGQTVSEQQVQQSLERLPPSRLRLALGYWFEELRSRPRKPDALSHVLPPPHMGHPKQARRPKRINVYIENLRAGGPLPCEVVEYFDDPVSLDPAPINSQTRKALGVVRGISGLCLVGSFSRWLQGVGSSFNDIDMIASREDIDTLISRLTNQLNTRESEAEISCKVLAREAPGCPELRLNPVFTITLSEGDLGQKVSVLQASVYPPETIATLNTTTATIPGPGEQDTVTCLAFFAEIELLNNTLQYLADQLDEMTTRLLSGPGFTIPRTILFNYPRHRQERVFGLLMRCLLSLNKAKQFAALLECSAPGAPLTELRTQARCLHAKLVGHSHREPFTAALNKWLAQPPLRNTSQASKCNFIRGLLAMVSNPAELF